MSLDLLLLAPTFSDRTNLMIVGYVAFLVSLTVHEAAHALVAWLGGDPTAYEGGQVSLNPLPHIRREPFGTVVLPLASMYLFPSMPIPIGFASTPVDPIWALRNPRRAALMALAGPVANFLLAAVAFAIIKVLMNTGQFELRGAIPERLVIPADSSDHGPVKAAAMILSFFLSLNIILGVLNLIPVPPLDGASVIEGVFPRTLGPVYQYLRSNGLISQIAFLLLIYYYGWHVLVPPLRLVVRWLGG